MVEGLKSTIDITNEQVCRRHLNDAVTHPADTFDHKYNTIAILHSREDLRYMAIGSA